MGVPLRNSPPRRSSGRNRSNRSSSNIKSTTLPAIRMSSSSSSSNSMGRKEIVQLTLIGMAICAGIMFSKASTINKNYKRLNDFYYYASTGTSNDSSINTATATSSSITAITTNDTTNTTNNATATTITAMIKHDKEYEIKLNELKLWRQIRNEKIDIYNEWFINKKGDDKLCSNADSLHTTESITFNITSTEQGMSLLPPLPKNGPILDFVVAGFPKCGTTGVVSNLMHITPYSGGDVCTPPDSTVYYAYKSWVKSEKKKNPTQDITLKFLRGTKCPKILETGYISEYSKKLPKTRLLVGIRHPVLWFQSFYNMQMSNRGHIGGGSYKNTSMFDDLPSVNKQRNSWGCANHELFCVARSKFYLPLASLGKTPMSQKEIDFLLSNDYKNDKNILKTKQSIKNPILLYEQQQPSTDYFWNDVSKYLYINRSSLPHMNDVDYTSNSQNKSTINSSLTKYEIQKSQYRKFNICLKERDPLRKHLMPISYNIYYWLMEYFIPASKLNKNNDIYISNLSKFIELIETYQYDPCNRLIRNDTDGSYYVPSELLESAATNISN